MYLNPQPCSFIQNYNHGTPSPPRCPRWCTRTTILSWSCPSWPSSATLRSAWTGTWCSAARTWQPWTPSPSRPPSPSSPCPSGTPRRRAPSPSTSAPRSPAASCSSATAVLRVPRSRSPVGSWRQITLPWSCWTGICTCWSIWAPGKPSWRPATRRSMMVNGAMWISRGKEGKVRAAHHLETVLLDVKLFTFIICILYPLLAWLSITALEFLMTSITIVHLENSAILYFGQICAFLQCVNTLRATHALELLFKILLPVFYKASNMHVYYNTQSVT